MRILDCVYKQKYENLKKDFNAKVKKQANEIYKERQNSWKVKEEEYREHIRFLNLTIREKMIELDKLNKYLDKVLNENNRFEL